MSRHEFPASGCWLHFFDPMIAELAGQAGYDYTLIDLEHGAGGLDRLLPVLQASRLGGARTLVRIPEQDPRWLGRVMDAGADGAMVPMVSTAAEAEAMARACLYPPAGTRGAAPTVIRASGYGAAVEQYLRDYRENFLLLVQIETAEGAANAGAIAAVDGIDGVFVGPFDLSASLGFAGQPDHARVRAAIGRIAAEVRAAGKVIANLPTPAAGVDTLADEGFDLIVGGSDMSMLRAAFHADAERHRQAQGRRA